MSNTLEKQRKHRIFSIFPAGDALLVLFVGLHFWLKSRGATSDIHLPAMLTLIASAVASLTIWRLANRQLQTKPYRLQIYISALIFFFTVLCIFALLLPATEIMAIKRLQLSDAAIAGETVSLYESAEHPTSFLTTLLAGLSISPVALALCWISAWTAEKMVNRDK